MNIVNFITHLWRKYVGCKCLNCSGTGKVDTKKYYELCPEPLECWVCHGTGRLKESANESNNIKEAE